MPAHEERFAAGRQDAAALIAAALIGDGGEMLAVETSRVAAGSSEYRRGVGILLAVYAASGAPGELHDREAWLTETVASVAAGRAANACLLLNSRLGSGCDIRDVAAALADLAYAATAADLAAVQRDALSAARGR